MRYQIQIPLAGDNSWHTLCYCETPQGAAEVVRILLENDPKTLFCFKIIVVPL